MRIYKFNLHKSDHIAKKITFFLLAFVVISESLLIFAITNNFLGLKTSKNQIVLEKLAAEVLENCKKASYRPACYDEKIPELMSYVSMEDAFAVTKLVQNNDTSYWYCHVLGHELSARETKKNPDGWKEVITRAPRGMCSNGAIHGAFQERFRTDSLDGEEIEKLKPDLVGICEPRGNFNPTGMEKATCYHALGHLAMYITAADLQKAVGICDYLGEEGYAKNYLAICYDGVYMQVFQPLEPEDIDLVRDIKPSRDNLEAFCKPFDGLKNDSCRTESWPLFKDDIVNPSGLVKFCSYTSKENSVKRCFSAMFYVLTAQFQFDEDRITELCTGLPAKWKGQCFANATSRMIETDSRLIGKAVDFCKSALKYGVSEDCFSELIFYSKYNFHPESKEFYEICNSLPGEFKDKCINRENEN